MTYEKAHKLLLSLEAAENGRKISWERVYIKSTQISHDKTLETTPLVAGSRVLSLLPQTWAHRSHLSSEVEATVYPTEEVHPHC